MLSLMGNGSGSALTPEVCDQVMTCLGSRDKVPFKSFMPYLQIFFINKMVKEIDKQQKRFHEILRLLGTCFKKALQNKS